MTGEPDPQWPREAWQGFVHEWRSYARTAWAVARHPRRFMAEYAEGSREALNPLACMLNVLAILAAAGVAARAARHLDDDSSALVELLRPALQLTNWSLVASAVHFPLMLFGVRRRWRTTMAAILYVTAGPLMPLYIVRNALFPTNAIILAHKLAVAAFGVPLVCIFIFYLVLTLSAAHRVAWWRVLLAFVLGVAVISVVAALLVRAHLIFSF